MSEKPRILVVEDDLDLAELLDAYFRLQEYDVVSAAWGRDALRISNEVPLNLVVLDIRLPDITGYDVCVQLRSQRRTQDVPIIFLTEKRDRVDKLHGLELGVVDYITKPFDIQELLLRVRNAIQRAGQVSSVHPVTGLPDAATFDRRLKGLASSEQPWALLVCTLGGLSKLRELHGFLAADEMLRAITLMLRNAVREFGSEDDFVGHLSDEEFVVLTTPARVDAIRERIETRVRLSLTNFYDASDHAADQANFLTLRTGVVSSEAAAFADAEAIRRALSAAVAPTAAAGE